MKDSVLKIFEEKEPKGRAENGDEAKEELRSGGKAEEEEPNPEQQEHLTISTEVGGNDGIGNGNGNCDDNW